MYKIIFTTFLILLFTTNVYAIEIITQPEATIKPLNNIYQKENTKWFSKFMKYKNEKPKKTNFKNTEKNPKTSCLINIANRTLPRDLNRLEGNFFNQDFKNENQTDRINRLEYRVFGALQNGTEEDRIQRLKKASQGYRSMRATDLENTFYPAMQPTFTTKNGWKGVFGNLNGYFNGVPTGMSPQIYYPPNNIYQNSYYRTTNPNRYLYNNGNSKYIRTNRGYYYNNNNAGTGTGITILD